MWKSFIYPRFLANLFGGDASGDANQVDYLSDTIKVVYLESTYSPSASHEFLSDVSGDEISVSGYSAGGPTLGSKTVAYSSTNRVVTLGGAVAIFSADVIAATDARYAAIYKSTGTDSTSPLLGYIDFGSVLDDDGNSNGSPQFGVKWNTDGIFRISSRTRSNVTWFGNAFASAFGGTSSGQDRRTDFLSDDIRFALVDNTATPNLSTSVVWADLSGDDLTSGGQALTGKGLSISGNAVRFTADDVVFSTVTWTNARYGIVYNSTPSDEPLLWICDLEANDSPSAENWTWAWGGHPIAELECA